jgi:hypothetical protein
MIFYHATPYDFDVLNEGSWVSSSLGESIVHLVMKCSKVGISVSDGYFIKMELDPKIFLSEIFDLGHMYWNAQTRIDIGISDDNKFKISENLHMLPRYLSGILNPSYMLDLTYLLQ